MHNRKIIFLSVLFTALLMGCARQYTPGAYQERSHDTNVFQIGSLSGDNKSYREEIVTVTEPNGVLTLGQILALTLMHNPELKVFSLETRATQARQLQAGLRPNPEIGIEMENVGGSGELSSFDTAETTIQLIQLIELGGKSQKRKNVASLEMELADLDYQNKRLEIFNKAAKAFIIVLKAQEKLQLSTELLKFSEESFETVEKRVKAGKDSPVETTRASVALTNIKILHRENQRNLEYSRKKLVSFWGNDKPLFKQASGNLDSVEQLPTLEDLIKQLKFNPEYVRWETEIEKSRAELDLEKSKAVGDLAVGAGVRRFNETDDNAFVFSVSIPLPLSDRNQGAKLDAAYNLAKSREQQKVALLKLQNEFNEVYHEFINSYSLVISLKNEILPAAIEMFHAATREYQEGNLDYLNLLDAQRTLFNVKNEYIDSLAAYHAAKIDIERLTGMKTTTINITESEQ